MEIAYIVICHRKTKILDEMIRVLGQENDIFLHIDKKSTPFFYEEYSRVKTIENRIDIRWGHFTLVDATLNLLKETKNSGKKYDYISLISGDDLPLMSSDEIKRFLTEKKGSEFIELEEIKLETSVEDRVKKIYTKIDYMRTKNILERIYYKIKITLDLYKKNPLYEKLPKLYKGAQWFTITGECRDYILDYLEKNPWYTEAFYYSYCPDESFFHTLIFNSKFSDKVYKKSYLRYIDWKTGPTHPRVLDETDFEKIKSSEDVLFARKFDDKLDLEKYRNQFCINKEDV